MMDILCYKYGLVHFSVNWSCFKHKVACVNITMLRCVTAVCLCKIIEKSVRGESFVFCPRLVGLSKQKPCVNPIASNTTGPNR